MLNELHLRTRQLNQIPIFKGHWINADRRAIQRRVARPFHMVHHKPMRTIGDGRHRDTWFANGGDNLCQRHLAARC